MSCLLTSDDIDLLHSLDESELETWLMQFPLPKRTGIITELMGSITQTGMVPTARQTEFLNLDCEEALYGGAAGGGKSEALLLWLAEGIHLPDYSAVIFRRTYPQLEKSNEGLIAKSRRLYKQLGGVFNGSSRRWLFPAGAMIELGHLPYEKSVDDYTGPSYHRVAYDELTQFTENQYMFIGKSRIRKIAGYPIRLGVRSATNPGGDGHEWVKARFVPDQAMEELRKLDLLQPTPAGMIFWVSNRAFVPARVIDNPHIDREDYINRMNELPPLLRSRIQAGDWSARADGIIKLEWLRRYTMRGDIILAKGPNGEALGEPIDCRTLQRFATIDTAGTSEEKLRESKGKPPSWSVCQIWEYAPKPKWLFLRHVWRARVDWDGLKAGTRRTLQEWHPRRTLIENAHFGPALKSELSGFQAELFGTGGKGKLERSTGLQNMLEAGQVFLPQVDNVPGVAAWIPALESEWLGWTGLDDETSDQIDTASMAANHVGRKTSSWGGTVSGSGLSRIGAMV